MQHDLAGYQLSFFNGMEILVSKLDRIEMTKPFPEMGFEILWKVEKRPKHPWKMLQLVYSFILF